MGFAILEPSTQVISGSGGGVASKSYTFASLPNGAAYLNLKALGGFSAASGPTTNLRIKFNSTVLGVFQFRRWTDHSILIPETTLITVPASAILSLNIPGIPVPLPTNQTLLIEAASGVAGDYFFIGPLIYNTN